jgi:hypothetical protein
LKPDPSHEGGIDGVGQVGGENRDSCIGFHSLQEVADGLIRVAVFGVFDVGAFADQRVGFVE